MDPSSHGSLGSQSEFSIPYNGEKLFFAVSNVSGGGMVQVEKIEAHSPLYGYLEVGDIIFSINGLQVTDSDALLRILSEKPRELRFVIDKATKTYTSDAPSLPFISMDKFHYYNVDIVREPNQTLGIGVATEGVGPYSTVIVSKVRKGSILYDRVRPLDCILAINGMPVIDKKDVARLVDKSTNLRLAMARRKSANEMASFRSQLSESEACDPNTVSTSQAPMSEILNVAIHREESERLGIRAISHGGSVIISDVVKGSPAHRKLKECDIILRINEKTPESREQAIDMISKSGNPILFRIDRPTNPDLFVYYKRAIEAEKARRGSKQPSMTITAQIRPPASAVGFIKDRRDKTTSAIRYQIVKGSYGAQPTRRVSKDPSQRSRATSVTGQIPNKLDPAFRRRSSQTDGKVGIRKTRSEGRQTPTGILKKGNKAKKKGRVSLIESVKTYENAPY